MACGESHLLIHLWRHSLLKLFVSLVSVADVAMIELGDDGEDRYLVECNLVHCIANLNMKMLLAVEPDIHLFRLKAEVAEPLPKALRNVVYRLYCPSELRGL